MDISVPHGAIDTYKPEDFIAGELGLTAKDFPIISREVQQFNQSKYEETKSACTIVNGARQWFHTMGLKFTDKQMIDIVNRCADNEGYVLGQAWNTGTAMNALAKYFRKFYPEYPCYYSTITIKDPLLPVILSRGHTLGFTYQGNETWNNDRKDGILEGKLYTPMNYGHRSILEKKSTDIYIKVADSLSITEYFIKYFKELTTTYGGKNIYPTFYVWVATPKAQEKTEQLKKFYKRKIREEGKIQTMEAQIFDTTDEEYKKKTIEYLKVCKAKLDRIMNEIKHA